MNRIDKMILKLSPKGIKYSLIKEIASVGTGSSNRTDSDSAGIYPFYVRSKIIQNIDTYEFDEEASVIPGEGGIGEIFHYVKGKYALHQRAYRIAFNTSDISTKFAYYYFTFKFKAFIDLKAVNGTVSSIRKPMIEDFPIPIPPIEIQNEIVRILDSFSELQIVLGAELEARNKQYSYYRDVLLNHKKTTPHKLGDLVNILDNLRKPIARGLRVDGQYPYYGANGIQGYVEDYIFDGTYILLGEDGSVINPDSSPVTNWVSGKIWVNNHAHVLSEKPEIANLRFIYYYLQICDISNLVRGVPPKLNQDLLRSIEIHLPELPVQESICRILDLYTTLITSSDSGLPAEISARSKQYEYYRERLLTFKELV